MPVPGWLWLQELNGCAVEILNDNRLNAYGAAGPDWTGRSDPLCRPHILDYDPCNLTPGTYTEPDDIDNPAPWFDLNDPASGDLLGFLLRSVTGLDGAHWSRAINQRTISGANLGALRAGSREMAFEVIVHAKTRQGLEYGRRWLEYQLAASCDPCLNYTAFVRLFTQDVPTLAGSPTTQQQADWDAEMRRGLYTLNGVAMTQGPVWGDPPLVGAEFSLQTLTFILVASQPCMNTCPIVLRTPTTVPAWDADGISVGCYPIAPWLCGPQEDFFPPTCFAVPSGPQASSTAAQVQIDAPEGAPRMMVALASQYFNATCSGLICSQIVLDYLPAGASVIVDGATEQVLFRANATAPWVPGDFMIIPSADTFTQNLWPKFQGCGEYGILVQPWSICGLNSSIAVSGSMVRSEGC